MPQVSIRQVPDDYAEAIGLAKYNRSRLPGCKDSFQATLLRNGTFITGLDEELEREAGRILNKDFSNTSDFWREFYVTLDSDTPKIFNTEDIIDRISLNMLIANKYVAPDKEAAQTVEYREAAYYAYTNESEEKEQVSTFKLRDQAISKLLDISESKEKLALYGQYLEGIQYTTKLPAGTLYTMLRAYIEDVKNPQNVQNFLDAIKRSPEELQQKIIVDKALKKRLIKKVNIGKNKFVYQYGQTTIGNTLEELYSNLSTVDYAPELLSIKKELEGK